MKKLYLLPLVFILFAACTKRDYIPVEVDPGEWTRSHDRGVVAYVDYETGNYIVDTYDGYTVIELWGGGPGPVEADLEYAYFDSPGVQTIYNLNGNYFSKGRIVDSWLSLDDALYLLDDLKYGGR
jgi:hypothetical protein